MGRRAVNDEQKQARQQAIIEAALELFEQTSYANITLDTVAAKVGVAKGTLYLYFKTREELFLAVLEQGYLKLYDDFNSSLESLLAQNAPNVSIEQVTDTLTEVLVQHWTLLRLMALLPMVLEQNVSYEAALRFKRAITFGGAKTVKLLNQCLPFLAQSEGGFLLRRIQAVLLGLQPMAEPPPLIQQVLNEPGLEAVRVDFRHEFAAILRTMLYGLQHEAQLKVSN